MHHDLQACTRKVEDRDGEETPSCLKHAPNHNASHTVPMDTEPTPTAQKYCTLLMLQQRLMLLNNADETATSSHQNLVDTHGTGIRTCRNWAIRDDPWIQHAKNTTKHHTGTCKQHNKTHKTDTIPEPHNEHSQETWPPKATEMEKTD